MTELNDHELLAEFARSGSEPAFAELVARHVNLVYSAALRFCGNPHHCEEITQAVFIILARKAEKLSPRVVLSGWLYQTARLTAANFVKGEIRRQQREQEAYMQSTVNETDAAAWEQLAPLLDEAMGHLGETDRNAVVLRFFENKTAAETAAALKLTEAAAHKRVNRALEKLRKLFSKRGVALSATLIAGAVSASSVQAAPAGLAATISTVALTKGAAAGGSTLTLVKGALKIMAWTKVKTGAVVGVAVILAVGTTTLVFNHPQPAKGPIPQAAWAFVKYGTPEAAFQSSLWAMSKGDMNAFSESLTPEFRSQYAATVGKGKTESDLGAMNSKIASLIGDFQTLSNEVTSSDEAILHFRSSRMGNATVSMKKIQAEWKINGNITSSGPNPKTP